MRVERTRREADEVTATLDAFLCALWPFALLQPARPARPGFFIDALIR
jgi:hypothetical protein